MKKNYAKYISQCRENGNIIWKIESVKQAHEETDHLNSLNSVKQIVSLIYNTQWFLSPWLYYFIADFFQIFKEVLKSILNI